MSDNKERKDVIKVLEGWTSRCKHSSNSIIKLEKKKTKWVFEIRCDTCFKEGITHTLKGDIKK